MANEKANTLTDKAIQAFKKPIKKMWVRDGCGLALCLTPAKSGAWRHWYFIYTSPESGKKVYKPLGAYPEVTIKTARTEATKLRADIAKQIDPKEDERRMNETKIKADAEQRRIKDLEEKAFTVSALFDDYIERHVLAILQSTPYLIIWRRYILLVRCSCALSPLPEVAVPRTSLA